MNFAQEYKNKINNIDSYIHNFLNNYRDSNTELFESMKYSTLNGGKRLRSVMCNEVCSMLGGKEEVSMPFAASIELIHAYSLVHDDLPAMDNSDMRRGMLSCHKKFGEANAILCGDALLNSAYELMAMHCKNDTDIKAMQIIAGSAGAHGMIDGQSIDLKISSDSSVDAETLTILVEKKTMAIIRAAIVSGAYLANADSDTVNCMNDFAYSLGIAFQIRDDFEDACEDCDSNSNSPNFINALGKEKASGLLKYHCNISMNILNKFKNNKFLIDFHNFLFGK